MMKRVEGEYFSCKKEYERLRLLVQDCEYELDADFTISELKSFIPWV